jgi:hypothetical protein
MSSNSNHNAAAHGSLDPVGSSNLFHCWKIPARQADIKPTTNNNKTMEGYRNTHAWNESSIAWNIHSSTIRTYCWMWNFDVCHGLYTLFHRFFYQVSLMDHDVWSVAMAESSDDLKIEEEQGRFALSQIALVFCHLYLETTLVDTTDNHIG